jgi:drug/metabolite transporter (DMT)-like permease
LERRPGTTPAAAGAGARPGPSGRWVGVGLAVGISAVSASPILVRVAHLPSLGLAFWRCFLGAAVLAPFAVRSRLWSARLGRRDRLALLGAGILLGTHFGLFIASLSFTTVASSSVLVAMAPPFVGLGSALLLGEPPSRRAWFGIALACAGAGVVGLTDLHSVQFGPRALLGDAMALAAAITFSGYLLIGRSARQRLGVSAYAAAVYGWAAALLLAACLVTRTPLAGYRLRGWITLGGVLVGPQLLGHTVFNGLLASVTASVVAVVGLAEPVVATILAWLLFGELPGRLFWFGAPLILAGVWLAVTREREPTEEPTGL